jgi:hypothetical protein
MSPLSKILRKGNGLFVFFLIITLLGSQIWVVWPILVAGGLKEKWAPYSRRYQGGNPHDFYFLKVSLIPRTILFKYA